MHTTVLYPSLRLHRRTHTHIVHIIQRISVGYRHTVPYSTAAQSSCINLPQYEAIVHSFEESISLFRDWEVVL